MSNTKQRGRPRNASRLNESDYASLERVADYLLANPGLKFPTTAMRRIGINNPNDHKRLLSKWWPVEDRYMRAAQARRTAAQIAVFEEGVRQIVVFAGQVGAVIQRVVVEGVNRYEQWARENPEQAAKLKATMVAYRDKQLRLEDRHR
ncbi:hypothetical protein [Methylobacterium sp. SI9]|uniref:hypothetical protein n=1 Tax=Methylobacterium guangdongense TaxID=3138811 RepID=UPI00313AF1D6